MELTAFSVEVKDNQPARDLLALNVEVPFILQSPARQLVGLSVECQQKTAARTLLTLNTSVRQKADVPRWDALVMLGGVDITHRVAGAVSVGGQAGQNKTASFQVKNPAGAVNPNAYINQSVTIDYIQPDGQVDRLFTGWVETPTYVFESGRTQITASTLRDKQLDTMSRGQIDALVGGSWSKYLSAEDAEGADYANDRLRTVAADLQVDARGALRLVSWALAAADYNLTGGDISEVQMGVTLQDAKSLVNSISVNVEYRYTRLRHRERDYHWDAPGADYWGEYMVKPYPLVPKNLIRSAIDATGWVLNGEVVYQDVPGIGHFNINGSTQGWLNAESDKYATAADWTLASRFTQTVTEEYSLTFKAPQSVEVWDDIPSTLRSHGITAEFADDEWDDMEVYAGPDPAAVQSPNGDWVIDATDTAEGGRAEFDAALAVVLQMYQRELLQAHRKNYVDIKMPKRLWAEIDFHHTVQITSAVLNCTGRVYSINHEFDRVSGRKSTRLRLVLSRAPASGSYSATPLNLPARPNVADQAVNNSAIKLGVHLGNSYGAPLFSEDWVGYISNYTFYDKVATLQQYPTAFIVDTPVVDDADRAERVGLLNQAYNVLIPNDPLEIINNG